MKAPGDQTTSVDLIGAEELPAVWSRCSVLAMQMSLPSVFCGGDWLRACAEHRRPEDEVLVLAVRSGSSTDDVLAVLPLVKRRNILGGYDFYLLGADFHPDPLGLICAPADREASIVALCDHLHGRRDWDRLIMDWCGEQDAWAWPASASLVTMSPFMALPGDFETLLSGFSRKKRQTFRAKVRRFRDRGGEFVIAGDPGTRDSLFSALWSLHSRRAEEKALDSTFSGARVGALHRDLVRDSGMVRLTGLRLDGEIVAAIYGFEFAGCFFYYQIAHDPTHASLSLGLVLIYLTCQDCCVRGLKEFNFLQGDEPYKGLWTKNSRPLYRIVWSRGTWRSRALETCAIVKGGIARLFRGMQ